MAINILTTEIIEMLSQGPNYLMENRHPFSEKVDQLGFLIANSLTCSLNTVVFCCKLAKLREQVMANATFILDTEKAHYEKLGMESLLLEKIWLIEDDMRMNAANIAAFADEFESSVTAEKRKELQRKTMENVTDILHKRHSKKVLESELTNLAEEIARSEKEVEDCKLFRKSIEEWHEKAINAANCF